MLFKFIYQNYGKYDINFGKILEYFKYKGIMLNVYIYFNLYLYLLIIFIIFIAILCKLEK